MGRSTRQARAKFCGLVVSSVGQENADVAVPTRLRRGANDSLICGAESIRLAPPIIEVVDAMGPPVGEKRPHHLDLLMSLAQTLGIGMSWPWWCIGHSSLGVAASQASRANGARACLRMQLTPTSRRSEQVSFHQSKLSEPRARADVSWSGHNGTARACVCTD
ncbi:hypothetical protein VUR80DRAFT_6939 [Thermomyces stellatus]